ncbi:MAG TPA: LuxR C-terminal-related transcriptional regulator [Tepidiformaceae bacterium]|nr:LuxR C-terminal-related transcriptional regulator [Tepidiformaceae bacterium]
MYTLRLASRGGGMLDHALAALVGELRPSWTVEVVKAPPSARAQALLELQLAGSERWIALVKNPDDFEWVAAALADGATAVLPLDADIEQLDGALRALIGGKSPLISSHLARGLAQGVLAQRQPLAKANGTSVPHLTPRETEVLRLVAAGLSNREIAKRLSLSVNTVRSHLQTLAVKLHATSRAKMIASAWGSGIYLEPEDSGAHSAAS